MLSMKYIILKLIHPGLIVLGIQKVNGCTLLHVINTAVIDVNYNECSILSK